MSRSYNEISAPIPEGDDWWRCIRYFPKTLVHQDFGYPIIDSDLKGPWQKGTAPQPRTGESFLKTGSSTVQFDCDVLKTGLSIEFGREGTVPQPTTAESVLKAGSSIEFGHEGTASQITADKSVLKAGSSTKSGHEGTAPQPTADESVLKAGSSTKSGHEGTTPDPRKDENPSQSGSSETAEGSFVIICSSSRYQNLQAEVVRDFVVVSGQNRTVEENGSVIVSSFTRRYMLPKECWGEQATIKQDSNQLYVVVKMNMPITH